MYHKFTKYILALSGGILVIFLARWTVVSWKLSLGQRNQLHDKAFGNALSEANAKFWKKACESDKLVNWNWT